MVDINEFRKCKKYNYWRRWFDHKNYRRKFLRPLWDKYIHFPLELEDYVGKKVLSYNETNEFIASAIRNNNPVMVSRFGGTEDNNIFRYYSDMIKCNKISNDTREWFGYLCNLSGFFPNDILLLNQFSDVYVEASRCIDLLATWDRYMEPYVICNTMPKNAKLTALANLEPWFADKPWSEALKGKRVLVVHPFTDSINSQYERRKYLFQNTNILPDFELVTFKAVQTIAGEKDSRFKDWFEALDYMTENVCKLEFDLAIVGCGAYGMPLAAAIRKTNRTVVHLAGATQLLFGIWGHRWDQWEKYKMLRNENWVLPSRAETPENSKVVEDNTYW